MGTNIAYFSNAFYGIPCIAINFILDVINCILEISFANLPIIPDHSL